MEEKIQITVTYDHEGSGKHGRVTGVNYAIEHDGKLVYLCQMTEKLFRHEHSPVREFHRWLLSNEQSGKSTKVGKRSNYTLRQRWIDFLEIFQLRCQKFHLKAQLAFTKFRISLYAAIVSVFDKR